MRPALRLASIRTTPTPAFRRALGSSLLAAPRPHRRQFTDAASHPANKIQFYLSRSDDPYLNLSIEHHLLQNSPPDSTVLFIYTNRPCIVIGRNQNPWVEVNLPLIEALKANGGLGPALGDGDAMRVELVRRRSGGGTVFHDGGNVNYSVICPPATFDRNKHAEMVVRALKGLGVSGARVNCRHDIVMDVDGPSPPASSCAAEPPNTFKVSGSAFKLTRLRSLHHGTCLLSSPNLGRISEFLRSPAKPFIKARGVESVRSKVRNVGVGNAEFEEGVREEFGRMYERFDVDCVVGGEAGEIPGVRDGMRELKVGFHDVFCWANPRLTVPVPGLDIRTDAAIHILYVAYGGRPPAPAQLRPGCKSLKTRTEDPMLTVAQANLHLEVRQGTIQTLAVDGETVRPEGDASCFYDLPSWDALLQAGGMESERVGRAASWLGGLLGSSRKTD